MRRRFRGSPFVVASLAWVVAAGARSVVAAPSVPVIDYWTDSDCPEREQFLGFLKAVIDAPEKTGFTAASDVRIQIEIRASAGGFRGSMEKIDRSGTSQPRVVSSASCSEVAQALALTAAFSLVPIADRQSTPLIESRVKREPRAPARVDSVDPGRWFGAGAVAAGGWVSPGTLSGIEASGGRVFPITPGRAPLIASLGLRATYARNDWTGEPSAARFALLTAAMEACALTRPLGRRVEVGLCVSLESGWLRASGVRIALSRSSDSLWLALGSGPLARLSLGGRWQLEGRGGALVPLRRVHFAFDTPAAEVGETPSVSLVAAFGLVARFP